MRTAQAKSLHRGLAARWLALSCIAAGLLGAASPGAGARAAARKTSTISGLVARCPRITREVVRPCTPVNSRVTLFDASGKPRRRLTTLHTKRGRFVFHVPRGKYLLVAEPGGCRSRAVVKSRQAVTVNVTCIVN